MPRFRWLAAALLLSLPARPALAQAPLGWRWQDKDSFYVEWKTHIDTVRHPPRVQGTASTDPRTDHRTAEDITAVYRLTLLNRHPDGAVDLEVQVESVKGEFLPERVYPRLLEGHTLRVALNAGMHVVRLEGIEPILRKRFGEGALPPQARYFAAEIEDACRIWIQDVLIPLPNRPVQAGEKWEQETVRALVPLGRHVLRKTFTEGGKVPGSSRELTRIAVTGGSTLVPYPEGEFCLPYKVSRSLLRSASYSGTYFLDPSAGRLVQGETRLKTTLYAVFSADGRDSESEADQEHVTTVRVLDHKPAAEVVAAGPAVIAEQPPPGADLPCKHLLTGEDSRLTAQQEKRIAELTEAGLWGEALKLARQVLELRVRVQGAGHWQAADAARNVQTLERLVALPEAERAEFLATPRVLQEAARLHSQRKETEAQALYDKTWEVRCRILGVEHHSTPMLYDELASALGAQGKRAEAQALTEKALDLCRRLLGEEHPDTARAYGKLGCFLLGQGRAAEAEPLLRRALAVRLRVVGEESVDTARALDNLGVSLNNQNRFAEAQPYHERALAVAQRVAGADDPDTVQCAYNLAVNLLSLKRPAEAEPLLRRSLEFRLRRLSEENMVIALNYSNLAASLLGQQRLAEAEPLLRKSLEIHRRVLGDGHMDTIRAYGHLGLLLRSVGKEREGDELLHRGEELFRRAQGG
jgi:tetratricopeptide (TPR) repeat protein